MEKSIHDCPRHIGVVTDLLSSLFSCFRFGIEKQNPNDDLSLKGVAQGSKESIADMTVQEPGPRIENIYALVSISDMFGEFLKI